MTEARAMVQSARAAGKLLCVAREDLAAPYSERARKRHEQLCAVLSSHAEIDIQLEDFFGNEIANPLSFAEIGSERRLLVVDCHYAVDVILPPYLRTRPMRKVAPVVQVERGVAAQSVAA